MRNWLLALRHSRQAIKQLLLSGRVVVGVGNIYACEALFRAGIRPSTPALRIGPARAHRLHAAIREVLAEAVNLGGAPCGTSPAHMATPGNFSSMHRCMAGRAYLQGVRHPGAHGAAGAAQQLLLSTLSASLI
jgi:formamidopyrimidine-DNA glycosylase